MFRLWVVAEQAGGIFGGFIWGLLGLVAVPKAVFLLQGHFCCSRPVFLPLFPAI